MVAAACNTRIACTTRLKAAASAGGNGHVLDGKPLFCLSLFSVLVTVFRCRCFLMSCHCVLFSSLFQASATVVFCFLSHFFYRLLNSHAIKPLMRSL
jgi:hypothetical protein